MAHHACNTVELLERKLLTVLVSLSIMALSLTALQGL